MVGNQRGYSSPVQNPLIQGDLPFLLRSPRLVLRIPEAWRCLPSNDASETVLSWQDHVSMFDNSHDFTLISRIVLYA